MIGSQRLLHKIAFPEHSSEADQFVAVTITEMRDDVPGICELQHLAFSTIESRKKHRGYKAEGEDGLNYYLNWASYLDGIPTPEWLWFQENTMDCWYDIAASTYFRVPFRPKFLISCLTISG